MFAVVNHLHFTKSTDEIGLAMRQEGLPLLATYPGFQDFYFVRVDDSHGIVIILWDTPANAMNGSQQFGPSWFAANVAPYLASEQQRSVGPV
ncbi:MAG: hypothetical protein IT319_05040, partial [Anaerolineae bacterium]|nr:hypothetical protein [Anaerolineae bacterium]